MQHIILVFLSILTISACSWLEAQHLGYQGQQVPITLLQCTNNRRKQIGQLPDKLSRDEAITFALEHNKALRVYAYDKTLAEADLLGARLYANPTASMVVNDPIRHEAQSVNAAAALTFSLADLWQRPFRVKVAERTLTVAHIELRQKVLDTVAATQKAYDELVYAQTQYRVFGLAQNKKFTLEKLQAQERVILARITLYDLLGIAYSPGLRVILTSKLTDMPLVFTLEQLLSWAVMYNPELERTRAVIEQSREAIRYEKSRALKDFNIGVAYTQDFTRVRGIGPAMDFKVPIFDQNNAQRARAEITLQKAYNEYERDLVKLKNELTKLFVTFKNLVCSREYYQRRACKSKSNKKRKESKSAQEAQDKLLESSFAARTTLIALERAVGKKLC